MALLSVIYFADYLHFISKKGKRYGIYSHSPNIPGRFCDPQVVGVGPLTIIVAALVNMVIRTIAVAFFGVPDGFTYLQAPFVIGSTVVFLLVALLAFVLVGRFARRPVRFYRILALVALFVSFLTPVMALTGLFPAPGMNLHIFWIMIVMHTVTAILTVSLLTTLAVEP